MQLLQKYIWNAPVACFRMWKTETKWVKIGFFHIWEYLPNSLYILNESYVRVNMFKQLKIGLKNFGEQIHNISSEFYSLTRKRLYMFCLLPTAFICLLLTNISQDLSRILDSDLHPSACYVNMGLFPFTLKNKTNKQQQKAKQKTYRKEVK